MPTGDPRPSHTCPTCGGPTCPHCGKSPYVGPHRFKTNDPYFRPWQPTKEGPYVGDVIPNPYEVTCDEWTESTSV